MDPRDSDQDLRDIAGDIIRGVKREYDSNTGLVIADGYHEQAIRELPNAHFYGLRSNSPAGTEVVIAYTEGGLIVVGERGSLPSGVAEPAAGATKLYNSQGCEVHLDENGDIVHEPKSGRHIKLGSGATQFVAMANKVLTELNSIQTWANSHTHDTAGVQPGGSTLTSATGKPTMSAPGSVEATKAKVE